MIRTSNFLTLTIKRLLTLVCFVATGHFVQASEIAVVDSIIQITNQATFELTTKDMTITDMALKEQLENEMMNDLNFGISDEVLWIKITLNNQTDVERLALEIRMSNLNDIIIYDSSNTGKFEALYHVGESKKFGIRPNPNDANYNLPLTIPINQSKTYYLSISNDEPLLVPLFIGPAKKFEKLFDYRRLFFGLYLGFMLAMALYNLFIYLSLKENIYLVYVIYLVVIFFAQSNLLGYCFQYFWPSLPGFANFMNYALPGLVFILGLYFAQRFLKIRSNLPKLNFALNVLIGISILAIGIYITGLKPVSYQMLQGVSGISAVLIIVISSILYRRNHREAGFYLLAWSLFLAGVFLYIFRDAGVLPYGVLTSYGIIIGSALETILLSFALADKINTLKMDKESSQRNAIAQMLKNEELITNQNIELEKNVQERTKELNNTIHTLKNTQQKLVESEKMASLGHLTSGVAHEINNPINFVSSSISPLKQDIDDLIAVLEAYAKIEHVPAEQQQQEWDAINATIKNLDLDYTLKEIDELLGGIKEGARRTSEIVKGLSTFSRSDKPDMEDVNLNTGIESTITILKNQLKGIELNLDLQQMPNIKCHLGKINQVVLNVLNNAVHAIEDRWDDRRKGVISIKSYQENEYAVLCVQDNGIGIKEEIQKDLFNPFFTTKEVGKGTGLGLSISYNIIDQHQGQLEFNSKYNEGTTFYIRLPFKHQNQPEETLEAVD